MEYREIVAVTGLGGLYQLLTTKSDGAIVRNVADKATRFISARQHNVTPLESIEVYTTGENVRLHHVFQKMKENETAIPLADAKVADNTAIKRYFKSIFPEFDEERVYVSDMKKMLKWYEVLKVNDLLRFEEQIAAEKEEGESQDVTEHAAGGDSATETVEEQPAADVEQPAEVVAPVKERQPKEAKKKAEAEHEKTPAAETEPVEEAPKPAKKAAKKKKTEE